MKMHRNDMIPFWQKLEAMEASIGDRVTIATFEDTLSKMRQEIKEEIDDKILKLSEKTTN